MYCGNCGAYNDDDSKYCGNCGAPLEELPGGTAPETDRGAEAPRKAGADGKPDAGRGGKGHKGLLVTVCILAGVLVIGAGGAVLWRLAASGKGTDGSALTAGERDAGEEEPDGEASGDGEDKGGEDKDEKNKDEKDRKNIKDGEGKDTEDTENAGTRENGEDSRQEKDREKKQDSTDEDGGGAASGEETDPKAGDAQEGDGASKDSQEQEREKGRVVFGGDAPDSGNGSAESGGTQSSGQDAQSAEHAGGREDGAAGTDGSAKTPQTAGEDGGTESGGQDAQSAGDAGGNAGADPAQEDYYAQLAWMEQREDEIYGSISGDTASLIEASNQVYVMWDDALNYVYQEYKKTLTDEEFQVLRQEELDWIDARDAAAEQTAQEWSGGSGEPYAVLGTEIEYTKQRVYELTARWLGY